MITSFRPCLPLSTHIVSLNTEGYMVICVCNFLKLISIKTDFIFNHVYRISNIFLLQMQDSSSFKLKRRRVLYLERLSLFKKSRRMINKYFTEITSSCVLGIREVHCYIFYFPIGQYFNYFPLNQILCNVTFW